MLGHSSIGSESVGGISLHARVVLMIVVEAAAAALEARTNPTEIGIAEAVADALDADITYGVDGTPQLVVSRSGTTVTIDVSNFENSDLHIYRAAGYRENFSLLTKTASVPYEDSVPDATVNYKYKASFVVEGIKGGAAFTAESRRSETRYTKGT